MAELNSIATHTPIAAAVEAWVARFRVVANVCTEAGTMIRVVPLSRAFRTRGLAAAALARLRATYPHAYVVRESMAESDWSASADELRMVVDPAQTVPRVPA